MQALKVEQLDIQTNEKGSKVIRWVARRVDYHQLHTCRVVLPKKGAITVSIEGCEQDINNFLVLEAATYLQNRGYQVARHLPDISRYSLLLQGEDTIINSIK